MHTLTVIALLDLVININNILFIYLFFFFLVIKFEDSRRFIPDRPASVSRIALWRTGEETEPILTYDLFIDRETRRTSWEGWLQGQICLLCWHFMLTIAWLSFSKGMLINLETKVVQLINLFCLWIPQNDCLRSAIKIMHSEILLLYTWHAVFRIGTMQNTRWL